MENTFLHCIIFIGDQQTAKLAVTKYDHNNKEKCDNA